MTNWVWYVPYYGTVVITRFTVPNVHSTLDTMRLFGVLYIKKSQNKDTTVGKIRSLHTTVEITMYEISVGLRQKNKKVLCSSTYPTVRYIFQIIIVLSNEIVMEWLLRYYKYLRKLKVWKICSFTLRLKVRFFGLRKSLRTVPYDYCFLYLRPCGTDAIYLREVGFSHPNSYPNGKTVQYGTSSF